MSGQCYVNTRFKLMSLLLHMFFLSDVWNWYYCEISNSHILTRECRLGKEDFAAERDKSVVAFSSGMDNLLLNSVL